METKRVWDFLERVYKEVEYISSWNRWGQLIVSALAGIAFGIIVGLLPPLREGNIKSHDVIMTVATSVLSGAILYCFMWFLGLLIFGKRVQIAEQLRDFHIVRRLEDQFGAFLFFVKSSNFERTLGWFCKEYPVEVKLLIARVIHQQLNRSFGGNVVRMYVHSYSDHSSVVADLLQVARNVCFTCIKSPKDWLLELDKNPSVEHIPLPSYLDPSPDFHSSYDDLVKKGYSSKNASLYPTHYVRFLERPDGGVVRRRAFLLEEPQWKNLVDPQYELFYRKFMDPIHKAGLAEATLFVRLAELQQRAISASPDKRDVIVEALNANITSLDYDLFERSAVLAFHDKVSAAKHPIQTTKMLPSLEFRVGPEVEKYSKFLDFLFENADPTFGVYSPAEVEEIIESNKSMEDNYSSDSKSGITSDKSKQANATNSFPKEKTG